jgi:hypothetical protein
MRPAAISSSVATDIKEAWHGRFRGGFMLSALAHNLTQADAFASDSGEDLVASNVGYVFGRVALL